MTEDYQAGTSSHFTGKILKVTIDTGQAKLSDKDKQELEKDAARTAEARE